MYKSKGTRSLSVQQVKDFFIEYKYATKSDIAEATSLSLATITNILKELENNHYIERIEDCDSTGGRKAKRYMICGKYMYFALMQLQVIKEQIKINYRIVDLNNTIVLDEEVIEKRLSIDTLITILQNMKTQYDFEYVSLSVPGIVDNGSITKSDIDVFQGINLKKEIEDTLAIKTVIENDVNTAMLGYINKESIKDQSIAFVYQPDNHHSGCGLYINDAIVYGASHFAGELAYLPNGSLEEQESLLKTNPLSLLIRQLQSIIALVNPTHMIVHTFCVDQEELIHQLKQHIPDNHLPNVLLIDSMEDYIFIGLASLCIESSRFIM